MTPYVIGVVLAAGVAAFARAVGFDRDRSFYPVCLVVIAAYYVLFAAMAGVTRALVVESAVMAAFTLAAAVGFRTSLWIVVGGLAGHGLFDFFVHGSIVTNPGMPAWWPAFCGAYDVAFAGVLAWHSRGADKKVAWTLETAQ